MSVIDYQGEYGVYPNFDDITLPPTPTILLLVKQSQTYQGGPLANGLDCNGSTQYMDTNPKNTTYQHLFITQGTRFLFDVTTKDVYDLSQSDQFIVQYSE